jgi:G:T-mismatch repair DNA endonuclease (very short patch repair protein)
MNRLRLTQNVTKNQVFPRRFAFLSGKTGQEGQSISNRPSFSPDALADIAKRAAKRQSKNCSILSGRLGSAAKDAHQQVTADLLELQSSPTANGVLHNLEDAKGREYKCSVGFEFAYSRLSDNYQKRQTTRQRKRIYDAFMDHLAEIKDQGLEVCFFTPTFPNLLGVGFAENADFHALAWELFLKKLIVRRFFKGGYNRTEFTLGGKADRAKTGRKFDLSVNGINWHSHALTILKMPLEFGDSQELENLLAGMDKDKKYTAKDKRLVRRSIRIVKVWTACLKAAHQAIFKKSLKIKTLSKQVKVTFQKVDISEIEEHSNENRKGILFELCGYTAKQTDFMELEPELLAEAEAVFRNRRVLNPFGCFKKEAKRKTSADKQPKDELINLSDPLLKQPTYRLKKEGKRGVKSLRYQTFTDAKKSLRKIGIEMCEAGKREDWLRHLEKIKNSLISRRRNRMMTRFPNGIFTDLTGQRYYGENAKSFLAGH